MTSNQRLFSLAYSGLRSQGFIRSLRDGFPVVCASTKPLVRCPIGHMYNLLDPTARYMHLVPGLEMDLFHSHMVAAHDMALSTENMRLRLEHVADLFSLVVPT